MTNNPQSPGQRPAAIFAVTVRLPPVMLALLVFLLALSQPLHAADHPQPSPDIDHVLGNYNFARASVRARLPKKLREVSGLVAVGGSTVALHTDNSALVWTFNVQTKALGSELLVDAPIPGDFEGIATQGAYLLLADSHGSISRFSYNPSPARPMTDQPARSRALYHPEFKERCVFEGLAAVTLSTPAATGAAPRSSLFLPCKYPRFAEAGQPAAEDHLLYVFQQSLTATDAVDIDAGFTRLTIDVSPILRQRRLPRLRPSAIEQVGDHLLILAGKERVLLETSLTGELLAWRRLAWPRHRQAEGLAVTAEGALVIADEGRWLGGTITVYQPSSVRTRK